MEVTHSASQAQRVLKQRNMFATVSVLLAIITVFALAAATTRDREVILQPMNTRTLAVSSGGVSKEYLELITRDASVMMFNRTPASLDYWMEQILKIVHPSYYGEMKGLLLRMVDDQRGSSVSYYFTMDGMKVDPESHIRGHRCLAYDGGKAGSGCC